MKLIYNVEVHEKFECIKIASNNLKVSTVDQMTHIYPVSHFRFRLDFSRQFKFRPRHHHRFSISSPTERLIFSNIPPHIFAFNLSRRRFISHRSDPVSLPPIYPIFIPFRIRVLFIAKEWLQHAVLNVYLCFVYCCIPCWLLIESIRIFRPRIHKPQKHKYLFSYYSSD